MTEEKIEAYTLIGSPRSGGVLIISDHASAHVPEDIDLGIAPEHLCKHIAIDIGVADVARLLVEQGAADAAMLGGVSRLVIDCNREEDAAGLIPTTSDGIAIVGNHLDGTQRQSRIDRFFTPYHNKIATLISQYRPAMILSLHSFTPQLESDPDQQRPWHVGVLYNEDERLAAAAIQSLEAEGLHVGDQLPYSGKILNATMNRHAEANEVPYIGIELRQDLAATPADHQLWAERLGRMIAYAKLKISA
jgi:predicted N-formylglutamate amidohydrolase